MAKKKKIRKDRIVIAAIALFVVVLGIYKGCSFLFGKALAFFSQSEEEHVYAATVVLDPGHGGNDVGAMNGQLYEKDITLKVAKAIGSQLESQNVKVVYTRTTDTALDSDKQTDLRMRAQTSTKNNADYFVSLHVNDYEDKNATVTGFEIYAKDSDGEALANSIGACLEELNYSKNRGIQDGSELAVIRQNTVPAVLVELGYINGLDISYLKDDDKLTMLGKTIARGIMTRINENQKTDGTGENE